MDNIFCFHEAIARALTSHLPLACLLLDFEKAYDRVEWGFLEGSLQCLGFPDAWIRGVIAFYRYATSAITIGGFVGSSFTLTRFIKQDASWIIFFVFTRP